MVLSLSRAQRDALHLAIVTDLTPMSDITLALSDGDVGGAQRLRQRFEQDVRILDQIGWEPAGTADRYDLDISSAEVAAFGRFFETTIGALGHTVEELHLGGLLSEMQVAQLCADVLGEMLDRADPQ